MIVPRPSYSIWIFFVLFMALPWNAIAKDKGSDEKVLAMELRAVRNVCVVPEESADGTPEYSDAGELAKVFRDNLNWEATVCDVEYHAGRTFVIRERDKYDAYVELHRRENTAFSSSNFQSRSVNVVFTPLRGGANVTGQWSYTNNLLFNPNELIGVAKKIAKSMKK